MRQRAGEDQPVRDARVRGELVQLVDEVGIEVEGADQGAAPLEVGERCQCGQPIWIIGSAEVGLSCFSCITGESHPDEDYEIDMTVITSAAEQGRCTERRDRVSVDTRTSLARRR